MKTSILCLFISTFVFFGCGGCDDENNVATDTGTDTSDTLKDDGPTIVCEPNAVIRCRDENTPAIDVCNADGTAVQPGSCANSPPQVCREDVCVDVFCIPGQRRCAEGLDRQECNADGSAWTDLESCSGASQCESGECLNRCQIAEATNSYVGCEYWAVELDNALLDEDNDLPEDEQPPFAIVLANTSSTFDSLVTIYDSEGQLAQADAERLVGTDVQFPGVPKVTVFSELVDQNGNRLRALSGPIENFPLPRNSIMTLIMPPRRVPFGASTITTSAYRVTTSQPVVAYQFNPLCCNYNFTNDASLLLPTSALTGNYGFLSYEVWRGGGTSYSATMSVVGTEADTQVTIAMRPSSEGRSFSEILYPSASARITGPSPAGIVTATIGPHEVLNLGAMGIDEDLTGARITTSKPVAVFGGHTCAFVPDGNAACDHLESQLFPVETWGRRFIMAPLKLRGQLVGQARTLEGTYFKILALEDETTITTGIDLDYQTNSNVLRQTSGAILPCRDFSDDPASGRFTLDANQSCALGSKVAFVAESGKPLLVGAFVSGQGSVEENAQFGDHAGDPAFFLVPPEEQFRSEYSFLTPETYFVSYVTVMIRPGFTVSLDGMELDLTQFDYEVIEDQNLARAHIPVEPGPHYITSENQIPFGIVVYGYDDYVSYAYTGGLDLTKLNVVDN